MYLVLLFEKKQLCKQYLKYIIIIKVRALKIEFCTIDFISFQIKETIATVTRFIHLVKISISNVFVI